MKTLYISDLDGTLLRNGAQRFQPELFDLIHRLKELGVFFVAASGRQFPIMQRMFAPVKEEIGYVCENGALTYTDGEFLYKDTLSDTLAKEIIQEIWEKEGAEMTMSGVRTYYVRPKTEEFRSLIRDFLKITYKEVEDFDQIPEALMKVAVYERNGINNSYQYWRERFSDRCIVVTSGFDWMDFVPFGTNKAKGIQLLQKRWNIKPEECMAFGDEYNDIEMLQAVEHSYAMDTAREGVKKVSRYITSNVEEELKKLIQEIEKEKENV